MAELNTSSNPNRTAGAFAGASAPSRLLAVVAVLLSANLVVQVSQWGLAGSAVAQPRSNEGQSGFITASEMINRTNIALGEVNQHLAKIEGILSKPIDVKVVSMPAVKIEGGLPTATGGTTTVSGATTFSGDAPAPEPKSTIRISPTPAK
jgi:hypothetical protein